MLKQTGLREQVVAYSKKIGYIAYLLLFIFVATELAFRFGLIPSKYYQLVSGSTGGRKQQRVLFLGDSFMVDRKTSRAGETVARLLRKEFTRRSWHSFNLAKGGTGPKFYLEQLKKWGVPYKPDLIILGYYVGNDLTDTLYYQPLQQHSFKRKLYAFLRNFYFGRFIVDDYRSYLGQQRYLKALEAKYEQGLFQAQGKKSREFVDNLLIEKMEIRNAWQENKKVFREIASIATKLEAKIVFNIFPNSFQVSKRQYQQFRKMNYLIPDKLLTADSPQNLWRSFCIEEKWSCVDLLPGFRAQKEKIFYINFDDHWNAKGNELAFKLIFKELENSDLFL